MITADFDSRLLPADFNTHTDNSMNNNSKGAFMIFGTFQMMQHVNGPTMELVISRNISIS